MAVGDVDTTSFEFYEGIRILLPGALAVGIYQALIGTFEVAAPEPKADALGALVAALAAGLLFYFVDVPTKSAYFLNDQPDARLDGITRPKGVGRLNLYFVLLDQGIPAGIRARALYMGSMYRIGYETIHLIAASAIAVLLISSAADVGPHTADVMGKDARTILILAAALQVGPLVLAVYFDEARARNARYKGRDEHRLRDIPQEVGSAGLVGLAGACITVIHLTYPSVPRELAVAGVVAATLGWMRRYFRGYDADRKPIGRSAASLLYFLAAVPACLLAGIPDDAATELRAGPAVGWSGMVLLAHVLIVSRGHEKRLGGSYATQKTWLSLTYPKLKTAVETGTLTHVVGTVAEPTQAAPQAGASAAAGGGGAEDAGVGPGANAGTAESGV